MVMGSCACATHNSVLVGFRDGLAMGLMVEEHFSDNFMYRLGWEATTGEDLSFTNNNPMLFIGALKWRLKNISDTREIWLSAGAVGYTGDSPAVGGTVSLVFEKLLPDEHVYLELGADILSQSHAIVQMGYRFTPSL